MALAAGYLILLYLREMGYSVWTPSCPISAYTTYECLGCGMNSAVIALMWGDFEAAWNLNPLLFLYLPLTFLILIFDIRRYSRKFKHSIKPKN